MPREVEASRRSRRLDALADVGNWNDRVNHGLDDRARRPRTWRLIDRVVGFLIVRLDRGR